MPMYDRVCSQCGLLAEDLLEPVGRFEALDCPECHHPTLSRSIATGKFHKASAVSPDLIPGGVEVKHGICWPDGTPRRYDSKSEMKRVASEMGLVNMVRHVPPKPDSDKAPHTVRWVSVSPISEEERVAHMRQLYREEGIDLDQLPPPIDTAPNVVLSETARQRVNRGIIAEQVHKHFGV